MASTQPKVGLFVTCLVDLFRPEVGFAAIKLLREAGCQVSIPRAQTCCGQPAYNSGDRPHALQVAKGVLKAFSEVDYLVAPSGSCAGMIKHHYPDLFASDAQWAQPARQLAARTYELVSFLTDVMGVTQVNATYKGTVTYHDSCSGLRELGIKQQPRKLLDGMPCLKLREMKEPETCCGFGGTFCVKYSEISGKMVHERAADAHATGADLLLGGDMGCLLNMAGKLSREGLDLDVRHIAEILAGTTQAPPIAGEAP